MGEWKCKEFCVCVYERGKIMVLKTKSVKESENGPIMSFFLFFTSILLDMFPVETVGPVF